jgi:hypothetical protein
MFPRSSDAHLLSFAMGLEPTILLHPAIFHLWNAHRLAQSITHTDPTRFQWEFAINLAQLRQFGLSEHQLRWLILKKYVAHCDVHRLPGQVSPNGHSRLPRLAIDDEDLFCLTAAGAAIIEALAGILQTCATTADMATLQNGNGHSFPFDPIAFPSIASGSTADICPRNDPAILLPKWDSERRELRLTGKLVKQFKWPAINQETILAAFQEEGWPRRIDDPLSPAPEIDPKRRLHDTIKCLNRNQKNLLLHFRGDGTGEGVYWERVHCASLPE